MVFIDRGNEDHKSTGRRAHLQAPGNLNYSGNLSNNGHANGNNDDDVFNREGDGGMRVGKSYQAVIPGIIPKKDRKPENCVERALLVWSPTTDISDAKLDEYVSLAKEKYGYNAEQALGMLFWHKHDLEKAILDLSNFTPFPDEWSVEDKVLFEQAFQFHGKSFHRIRQMLPDKSIASLVKYYYSWKKTRSRTSLIDRQAKRLASQREDGSEVNSEIGSNSDTDSDDKQEGKWHIHRGIHRESCSPTQSLQSQEKEGNGSNGCSNCGISCSQANTSQKGQLCGTCYHYWRKTGASRPTFGAIRARDGRERRKFRKPPKGMYICHEDLSAVASGSSGQGDAILKHIDDEIINLKRQVQNNKQILSTMKRNFSPNINCFRPNEVSQKLNIKWTNEELLLAVQGVKKHGKDYKMIAEVVGNKTESQLKNFFVTYRRRYNLDAALKEYEEEHGPLPPDDEDEDDDIKIEKIVPGDPAQPPTLSTVSLTNASSPAQAPVPPVKQSIKPA